MNDTRMLDLVRAARSYLYTEELISDEEYAHLAALPSTESHERMRGYDDLCAQLAAVTRERDEARSHLSNLLARIHRDGGHHEQEVGTAKAVEEADKLVAQLVVQFEARADAARLREAAEFGQKVAEERGVLQGVVYWRKKAVEWRGALASTPSTEPTPRDMRVAEALDLTGPLTSEVLTRLSDVQGYIRHGTVEDLAAVVAKAGRRDFP